MFRANGKGKDTSSEEEINFASPLNSLPLDLEMFILDEFLSLRDLLKLAATTSSFYKLLRSPAYNFLWEHKYKKHFSHLYDAKKLIQKEIEIQEKEFNWYEEFKKAQASEYSVFQKIIQIRASTITESDIEELFSLVNESDVQGLEKLNFLKDETTLKKSCLFPFNIRDKSGNSLITCALKINNPHVLNFIYEIAKKYFTLLKKDSNEQTLLDWAFIFKKSYDEIFEIVYSNVNVHFEQTSDENLLVKAIENSRTDIVIHYLELNSQSKNITENYLTLLSEPMQTAVSCGNFEIIKILLNAEPKLIDVKNWVRENLLIIATKQNNIALMKFLLEKKPQLLNESDFSDKTALIIAASQLGILECVNFLLEQENIHTNGTLQGALLFNQFDIAIVIAETEIKNATRSGAHSEERLQELSEEKISLILQKAVRNGNLKIVEELIERFPKLRNSKSCLSPENILMIAVKENCVGIAEYFLKQSDIEVYPQTISLEQQATSHACVHQHNVISSAMSLNRNKIIDLFISLKREDFKKIFKLQCDSIIKNILFLFNQIQLHKEEKEEEEKEENNISYAESLFSSVYGLFFTPVKKLNHSKKITALISQIESINEIQKLSYPEKIEIIFQYICKTYDEIQNDILENKLGSSDIQIQLYSLILNLSRSNYVSLYITPSKIKFKELTYWLKEGEKLFADAADELEENENENERPTITTTMSMNKH